jgi:hypothetical protein
MILSRGDRILFINQEDRLRAGHVEGLVEDAGRVLLAVSTEAGTQVVPLDRLQARVTLRAETSRCFEWD